MKINHLISINMLPELLKHDYLFIDLREPYQYKQLHLTKFINIPYQDFTIDKLDCPKNKPIFDSLKFETFPEMAGTEEDEGTKPKKSK